MSGYLSGTGQVTASEEYYVPTLHACHAACKVPGQPHLLSHAGARIPLVVVSWVDDGAGRQAEDLRPDGLVEGVGVAVLEVSAATAAHQKGIT